MLLVDGGNTLFESALVDDERARARAELIMKTMGELKTAVMPAGLRDLAAGPDYLASLARKAGVQVVSANLMRNGKPIFPASAVVPVAGVKVGFVGLSPAVPFAKHPGVAGEPPVQAAVAEAKRLRGKVDLVVALAAVPYADALQLSREAGAAVDLIIQSNEMRPVGGVQRNEANFVLAAGERGKAMGQLVLDLGPAGPLVDLAEADRARSERENLERQVAEVKKRMEASRDPDIKRSYRQALESFEGRLAQLQAVSFEEKAKGARTMRLLVHTLGADVQDDPALKTVVERLQPPGETAGH